MVKKYIDFNTDKIKNAANSFEKYFFMLMNNSTFGKTMENLRKRINVRLVSNTGDYKKYVSKPSFVSQKIFSKNFVAIQEIKPVLTLDKPICVGFSILGLCKFMNFITNTLKENIVPSCCLQTQTVKFMKLKQMMFMKIFMKIRNF